MCLPSNGPLILIQKRLDRSCMLCHQRKIRCDKKSPCGNCTRADVMCCFPKTEQQVRRPHKITIADVPLRLARLEKTVNVLTAEDFSTPLPLEESSSESPAEERLINGDCSSQYFNESLLSRIMEEAISQEKEIHSLIGLHVHEDSSPDVPHAIEIEPLLSSFYESINGESYHPTRSCAVQLWQAFVNNVDPMIKIFHTPSTQAVVYAAIKHPNEAGAGTAALLLAIYFAATASLSHNSVVNILGQGKNTALNHFKRGLEQSLAASKFLDKPNLMTLQAITLYLRCLRVFIRGRSLWSLNGLVVRSAQSIGLHRDGKNLNLSPFECEIRHRLWWYIVANDSRVGEDHGLTILSFDSGTDVALPLNVNDSQIEPNMRELPPAEMAWTEMSFTIIVMEVNKVLQEINQSRLKHDDIESYEAARQETICSLVERQDRYLQCCDENIPAQRAAYLIGRLLTAKLQFITRQHSHSTASGAPKMSQDTDNDLGKACDILELSRLFSTDDMLQGFWWICQSFPQYNILMYVLWRLSKKPVGPNVDRAWGLVDASFEGQDLRRTDWNWAVLEKLRAKARHVRVPLSAQNKSSLQEVGTKYQCEKGRVGGLTLSSEIPGGSPVQDIGWTSDVIDDFD
ncbi:hypothetical protein DL98DRAFT_473771 [Cadophora sp. DSE1049]|nr:hypothetical protein DL98DRAFT_473771 [Cadophora sp. DSE1049]